MHGFLVEQHNHTGATILVSYVDLDLCIDREDSAVPKTPAQLLQMRTRPLSWNLNPTTKNEDCYTTGVNEAAWGWF